MTKARKIIEVAEISEAEIAVRIMEGLLGMHRPSGATAEEALAGMPSDSRDGARRAARNAMDYIRECVSKARIPS
jgi:hypothetical protein